MTWAALFPFVLGFLPFLFCAIFAPTRLPRRVAYNLINAGVETVTMCSLMKGAFEIADTWTYLPLYLMICGGVIWLCGVVLWIAQTVHKKETTMPNDVASCLSQILICLYRQNQMHL